MHMISHTSRIIEQQLKQVPALPELPKDVQWRQPL